MHYCRLTEGAASTTGTEMETEAERGSGIEDAWWWRWFWGSRILLHLARRLG